MPPLQTPMMPNGQNNNDPRNVMLSMTIGPDVPDQPVKKPLLSKQALIYLVCGIVVFLSAIVALACFMDQSSKATEIAKLKRQLSGEEELPGEGGNTSVGNRAKNPVFEADYPDVFNVIFESEEYELDDDASYRFALTIREGKPIDCTITKKYFNDGGEDNIRCTVDKLTGNIYKVVDIVDRNNQRNDLIAFLMEDGTIDYAKICNGIEKQAFEVAGKIDAGGFVTDAMNIKFFDQNNLDGRKDTVFTLSDGSFAQYRKSMLHYN